MDSMPKPQESNTTALDQHQKEILRQALVDKSKTLIGIPYHFGAEWVDRTKLPESLDCSELIEGVFVLTGLRMPDGGQQQFDFTVPTGNALPGDLGFFAKSDGKIYHVGMVFDEYNMIEARGCQPESSFETGKVILRPRTAWENYKSFAGYRSHPKLA